MKEGKRAWQTGYFRFLPFFPCGERSTRSLSNNKTLHTDFFDGFPGLAGVDATSPSLIEATLSPSVPTFGGAKLPFEVEAVVRDFSGVDSEAG